jgi:hypothetical protein
MIMLGDACTQLDHAAEGSRTAELHPTSARAEDDTRRLRAFVGDVGLPLGTAGCLQIARTDFHRSLRIGFRDLFGS